jgi:hypothetical protein
MVRMLDDQDRRSLREIENGVARDDPAFARSFHHAWADTPPVPVVLLLCVALYIAAPLVSLLFGWRGLVVLVAAFLIALAVALVHRRRRRPAG